MKTRAFNILSVVFIAAAGAVSFAFVVQKNRQITEFLPGTQPGQSAAAATTATCMPCHPDQVRQWSGSMMGQSVRDPVFNAVLSVTSKATMPFGLAVGEYCLRCHAPTGWLMGRTQSGSSQELTPTDLDEISCDYCHRSLDPLHPDTSVIVSDTVPGYGNGMYVTQKFNLPVRGARGVAHPGRSTVADKFYRKSEYCGVCHDVSNPYLSADPRHTLPYLQVPLERTLSEWQLSWYATQGDAGTCQACHMRRVSGYAASSQGKRYRLDVASHDFLGANVFSLRSVRLGAWPAPVVQATDEGAERTRSFLTTSAFKLDIQSRRLDSSAEVLVRVTNLTGHKLPTGFPDGRQMWISIACRNITGETIFRSGVYDSSSGELAPDPQLKVYEIRNAISSGLARALGLSPGESFLDAVTDSTIIDNRIPPRGFQMESFREHRAQPVGYHYDDGQYWDLTTYTVPAATAAIEVSVYYQIASKAFMEFLRAANAGNPYDWNQWGEKAYEAWKTYGQPVLIGRVTGGIQMFTADLPSVETNLLPLEVRLAQNYPNPFNGLSTIEFYISNSAQTSLNLYDITGKIVAELIREELPAGVHTARVDGAGLASGTYLYRLTAGSQSRTGKLLLVR